MRIDGFDRVGDWKDAAKNAGYLVPLPMCHGLSVIMKELDLPFREVFTLLVREGKIVLSKKVYAYDMSAHNAWLEEMKEIRRMFGDTNRS